MRIFSILAVVFLVGIAPAHGQSDQTTDPPTPDRCRGAISTTGLCGQVTSS